MDCCKEKTVDYTESSFLLFLEGKKQGMEEKHP